MVDPSLFTVPYDRALMLALSRAGHGVRLHGRHPGPEDNATHGIDIAGDFYRLSSSAAVARLPNRIRLPVKGVDHAASMLALRRRLRAHRPDILHFQWLPLPFVDRHLLAGLGRIAPLVLTVHDTNPFNGDPSAALQARGFARCLPLFDHLIVHTRQGRDRLLDLGLDAARVSVLPHGLIEDIPNSLTSDMPTLDVPTLDVPGSEVTFLLFGKLKPYKGLDVLVEAFALLPASLRAQARLRIVGKAYMPIEPIEALARTRGIADRLRIEQRFVADDAVSTLFGRDVVAVFPYREIEASGVLSYALANGRPVIASALGGFADVIEDGVQGLLVPPGDAGALSRGMGRMVADRAFASRCGAQARSLAEAVPDWDTIARQTVAVYAAARSRAAHRLGAGQAGMAHGTSVLTAPGPDLCRDPPPGRLERA